MLVELESLKANPMRDFIVDPIDAEVVAKLKDSIQEHGFWGGVVCRQLTDGTIEIAAGHHRIQAALEAGITQAELFVRTDPINNAEMLRLYATENGTQRGTTTTALAGTVAGAIRFLAKMFATGTTVEFNSSRALNRTMTHFTDEQGIGRDAICELLHGVPGINANVVRQQLDNLKSSGDYARILHEVEEEIAREEAEALAERNAAEAERRQLLQVEMDAQAARLQAEQEAQEARERAEAAREREEQARREAIAKMKEVERKEAEGRAKLAEQRRREADAKERELAALREQKTEARARVKQAHATAAERPITFDFEGVAKYLKNAHQLDVFREVATSPGVQPYLPVEEQAALAADIVAEAQRLTALGPKHVEVTGAFIREHVIKLLLQGKDSVRADAKARHESLMRVDIIQRAEHYMDQFVRSAYSMASTGKKLADLCATWPNDVAFPESPEFRKVFANVQQILYDIDQAIQERR